ncbi:MAG: AMP-binding protein [Candidatus Coprovivens sp.]
MKQEMLEKIIFNSQENGIYQESEDEIKKLVSETEKDLGEELTGYIRTDKPYRRFAPKKNLDYPNCKIASLILDSLDQNPNEIGIICGREIKRSEIKKNILIAADALKSYGLKKNDIITICSPSTPEVIYYFLAANILGVICRPIDPISSKITTRANLEATKSKLLLTLDLKYKEFAGITEGIDCKVVGLSINDTLPKGINLKNTMIKTLGNITDHKIDKDADWFTHKDFISNSVHKELKREELEEPYSKDDIYCIFSSSGTSGNPKGIVSYDYSMVVSVIKQVESGYRRKPNDKIFNPMPSYSSYFWNDIYYALVSGIPVKLSPLFSVDKCIEEINKSGCSIILCGPIILERLNQYIEKEIKKGKTPDYSYLSHIFSGGDMLRLSLERRTNENLRKCGASIHIENGYGTSETEGPAVIPNGALNNEKEYAEGSVGTPMVGDDVVIFPYDEENNTRNIESENYNQGLQYFQIGEICLNVENPEVFAEYYNDEEATNLVKIQHTDGTKWYHTGDLGYMDPAGHLFCAGRKYGMIVRQGHKIWTSKINSTVRKYENVIDCETIGIPDSTEQEVPMLFIVFAKGISDEEKARTLAKIDKDLLQEYDSLHIPKFTKELDAIPRNLMLKSKLKELNAIAEKEKIAREEIKNTQTTGRLLKKIKRVN